MIGLYDDQRYVAFLGTGHHLLLDTPELFGLTPTAICFAGVMPLTTLREYNPDQHECGFVIGALGCLQVRKVAAV